MPLFYQKLPDKTIFLCIISNNLTVDFSPDAKRNDFIDV